jgi:hypothetical protein
MVEEITSICRRYGYRRLSAIDNTIDWKYYDSLKANLTKALRMRQGPLDSSWQRSGRR